MSTASTAPAPCGAGGLTHRGLVYGSDEEFLATTAPFLREGVERGEAVLSVNTAANTELLRQALGGTAREVEFLFAEEFYESPGNTLGAYRRYVDEHTRPGRHTRIRVVGEPVWRGLDALETAEWTRYEAAVNLTFAACPASIICPYDTRVLPEGVVADARRTHPQLAVGASARPSAGYAAPTEDGGWRRAPMPVAAEGEDVSMRFGADLTAVRQEVAKAAAGLGLSPERAERLVFAVNEVATNAVQHGSGAGHLSLRRSGRRVVCDVTSRGGDEAHWYLGYLPPDPGQPRGHGMWVVRQLCDLLEVHTERGRTTVRLHIGLG
ncbi:sensor histidine kinase [Streptomyces sp. NPDC003717]|uniref:sensor histidine kinase n=1 Tax=Streptomyces sp. NPDC003717 TaxID=3154276 RepID=UPI0033B55641